MQEDRDERSGLLRFHEDPSDHNERDDRRTLARRSGRGATQRLGRERQREDEERRPEIAERREVSRRRQGEGMPRVLVRALAARGDARRDRHQHGTDREREREPVRPEEGGELRRPRSRDVRVDPVLLEQSRREAHVLRDAIGHRERTGGESCDADQPSGQHGAPPARCDIEEEQRERQELESYGRRQEQARRERAIAEAPRREREAEREEIHVAERDLEDEAEEEDVTRGRPRPPQRREPADERDAHRRSGRDLQHDPDRKRHRVRQKRERYEEDRDDR